MEFPLGMQWSSVSKYIATPTFLAFPVSRCHILLFTRPTLFYLLTAGSLRVLFFLLSLPLSFGFWEIKGLYFSFALEEVGAPSVFYAWGLFLLFRVPCAGQQYERTPCLYNQIGSLLRQFTEMCNFSQHSSHLHTLIDCLVSPPSSSFQVPCRLVHTDSPFFPTPPCWIQIASPLPFLYFSNSKSICLVNYAGNSPVIDSPYTGTN